MCGIAGLLFAPGKRPEGLEPQSVIRRMIERLRHRGPEAVAIQSFNQNQCWLAHARLRVTDDREVADQPFSSQNNRWRLVFNGEIYNWQQLDTYLSTSNWKPKTEGDTERLVEIINKFGYEALHCIDGMFAFGAYDEKTKRLFLARDRLGQKPLYYVSNNGIVAFASELSALLELSPWIAMEISIESTSQFFRLRYIPAPNTAINPIKKLEPGQYAIINQQGKVQTDRFFTLCKEESLCTNDFDRAKIKQQINSDPQKFINSLIKQSIKQTTPQNAAVIVSGGVDSTLMASYIAELDQKMGWNSSNRRGYTIQLEHQPPNEANWAKSLCRKWGWNHELISLTDRQLINSYLRVVERLDEPLGDRSLLPSWSLAQSIQPHQRVAIGGDGGDELFLGYERYLSMSNYLIKEGRNKHWAEMYWSYSLSVCDPNAARQADQKINIQPMNTLMHQTRILQEQYSESPINFLQILDLFTYLPGSVLAKADRTSMDWGVETRSPLLNTQVALAALSLENKNLVKDGAMKFVLREILREKTGNAPGSIKHGFGAKIRNGSELENFLVRNTQQNIEFLSRNFENTRLMTWIQTFLDETKRWNQNSLFALSVWTDWVIRISKEFPSVSFAQNK